MRVSPADREPIAPSQMPHLADWRSLAGKLRARFRTGDFAGGVALVERIAAAAEAADHHPDVDLRYGYVEIAMSSHDVGAITQRDIRLAEQISADASELGAVADADALRVVSLALDTIDPSEIRPFWMAVLRLSSEPDFEDFLFDPEGCAPRLFLQAVGEHPQPAQRFHVDLVLPPELIQGRISDAVAAGGRLVSDEHAPAWWTLADPHGNQIDLATWQGRD